MSGSKESGSFRWVTTEVGPVRVDHRQNSGVVGTNIAGVVVRRRTSPYPSPRRCKSLDSDAPRARGRPRGAESQGTPDLAPGPWVTPAGPASRPPGLTREAASRARDGCGSVKLLEASPRRRLRSGDRGGPARSESPSARTEEASGRPLATGLHKRRPSPGRGPGSSVRRAATESALAVPKTGWLTLQVGHRVVGAGEVPARARVPSRPAAHICPATSSKATAVCKHPAAASRTCAFGCVPEDEYSTAQDTGRGRVSSALPLGVEPNESSDWTAAMGVVEWRHVWRST